MPRFGYLAIYYVFAVYIALFQEPIDGLLLPCHKQLQIGVGNRVFDLRLFAADKPPKQRVKQGVSRLGGV